jgi:hypothetical protein
MDLHHYFSLDSQLAHSLHNKPVPAWQLWLLRMQMIVMYQISGLKKCMAPDWVAG